MVEKEQRYDVIVMIPEAEGLTEHLKENFLFDIEAAVRRYRKEWERTNSAACKGKNGAEAFAEARAVLAGIDNVYVWSSLQ